MSRRNIGLIEWSVLVLCCCLVACGVIQNHRQLDQPIRSELTTGIGGTLFRLNKSSDLPNVFGARDIYGGKIDRGFAEIKLVGIEDQTLVLDVVDVNRQSSETVMDRYKPFQQRALMNVDVQQSVGLGSGEGVKPTRVQLDIRKQRDFVLSGIRVVFKDIQPYGVRYTLEDVQAQ